MSTVKQMVNTHPQPSQVDQSALIACIEECYTCAQTCTACADACLGESQVQQLVRCIRLNLDCFDACVTTGNMLSRQTEPDWAMLRAQVEACAAACRACGAECENHAQTSRALPCLWRSVPTVREGVQPAPPDNRGLICDWSVTTSGYGVVPLRQQHRTAEQAQNHLEARQA